MATHLVLKKCGVGSLGVPSPASTPLALGPGPQGPKTMIFLRFFKGLSQKPWPASQPKCLPWLGWLACCALPWLGLAWACLACLASNNNRPPSAAGGGCAAAVVVAGPGQGKAGKAGETGPGQSKPRQGTTSKPAKPRLAGWSEIWIFFQNVMKRAWGALGGPPAPWGIALVLPDKERLLF